MFHQHLAALPQTVDIGIGPIALVGQHLQGAVVEIASAKSHDREEDPGVPFTFDEVKQVTLIGDAHVEVPIGRQ